jgi:predicted PurR-regulated permease PerM
MKRESVGKMVLLILVLFISAVFVVMIRKFLLAVLMAGIFSALAHPLYSRLMKWMRGNKPLASVATLLIYVFVLLIPTGFLFGIVTSQAIKVGQTVTPWVQAQIAEPAHFSEFLSSLPFYEQLEPYREVIYQKAGEAVGATSRFLIDGLSSATLGTVNFVFMLFIFLYTMFFFLSDGERLLNKILYYLPLEDQDERRMLDRFTSVTRATLKGTAVIGVLQGALAGAAFAVVGIPSAAFWGTVMTVLSIIPGIGSALVWGPAAIILAASGGWIKAIGLALFCGLVVGSLDNFLRPRLVGRDTEMHDLMILFATLGGLMMFGVLGFIIGPVVAALFVTVWDIYAVAFKDILPAVNGISQEEDLMPLPPTDSDRPDRD